MAQMAMPPMSAPMWRSRRTSSPISAMARCAKASGSPMMALEPSPARDFLAGLGARPFICTGSDPRRHGAVVDSLSQAATFPIAHEPTMDAVREAAAAARAHGAGVVVGLGGGAALDAAKVMWCFYEHPHLQFADIITPGSMPPLRTDLFTAPRTPSAQGELFRQT